MWRTAHNKLRGHTTVEAAGGLYSTKVRDTGTRGETTKYLYSTKRSDEEREMVATGISIKTNKSV